jgi:hypothetical protein
MVVESGANGNHFAPFFLGIGGGRFDDPTLTCSRVDDEDEPKLNPSDGGGDATSANTTATKWLLFISSIVAVEGNNGNHQPTIAPSFDRDERGFLQDLSPV